MVQSLAIIVPCFNEEKRIDSNCYLGFLRENKEYYIYFVNDGSSDKTLDCLREIKTTCPKQVFIINQSINKGKAETVRNGMMQALSSGRFKFVGYFDADLSIPLEEYKEMLAMFNNNIKVVMGSRISRLGSNIEKSLFRHIAGRFIATIISKMLKLSVYDTQCGAKVFSVDIVRPLFDENFKSTWLFDVEILARAIQMYGHSQASKIFYEYPLKKWIHKSGSKVKISYIFYIFYELLCIKIKYKI